MLQRILIKKTEIKKKKINDDINFTDPKDNHLSQLKKCRNYIIKKIPLVRNFSWELGCSWKKLKKKPIMQNKVYISEKEIDLIVEKHQEWVRINTCYAIKLPKTKKRKAGLCLFKCAKRGNSVYRKLLDKKLDEVLSFMEDEDFQDKVVKNIKGFSKKKKVSILFISLTCNQEKMNNNLVMAWFNIQDYYNRFITGFRQKYGETFVIKTVEAQTNGFPHIHLFIICECRNKKQRITSSDERIRFNAFEHKTFNKKTQKWDYTWRVEEKKDIENLWKFGFSDVKVPINFTEQSYKEFIKDYMFKDMFKSFRKGYQTKRDQRSLALGWLFGNQCFSISHRDLIFKVSITQIQKIELENYCKREKAEFLGFVNVSCKSVRPPPDINFISETDENYRIVLSCIRKPQWLIKKNKEKSTILEKEKIRLKNLKYKNQNFNIIKIFKNADITKFEIIKNPEEYQPKTLIVNLSKIKISNWEYLEDIKEKTRNMFLRSGKSEYEFIMDRMRYRRLIDSKNIKLDLNERIDLAVKGVA